MNDKAIKIGMTPPHPGVFIREEILGPLRMQAWYDTNSMRQQADRIDVKPYTAPAA